MYVGKPVGAELGLEPVLSGANVSWVATLTAVAESEPVGTREVGGMG